MEPRESFVFYLDWIKHLELLPSENAMEVLHGIVEYKTTGIVPTMAVASGVAFSFIRAQLDRDDGKYLKRCQRNRENGISGGRPPKPKETQKTQSVIPKPKKPDTDPEPEPDPVSPTGEDGRRTPAKPPKKSFGAYGWVKLTDEEYARLLNDLGQAEAARCIAYVDESAQTTGNKNKWRDWNLTVRKCCRDGWGLERKQGGFQGKVPMGGTDTLGDLERQAIDKLKREFSQEGGDRR